MKKMVTLAIVMFSVWTYGSETLDTLAARGKWETFQARLQCDVRNEQIWCAIDGIWYTIADQPIPVPYGL